MCQYGDSTPAGWSCQGSVPQRVSAILALLPRACKVPPGRRLESGWQLASWGTAGSFAAWAGLGVRNVQRHGVNDVHAAGPLPVGAAGSGHTNASPVARSLSALWHVRCCLPLRYGKACIDIVKRMLCIPGTTVHAMD